VLVATINSSFDMHRIYFITATVLNCLLLFHVLPVNCQNKQKPEEWTGKFKDGTPITRSALDEIINEHRKWIETNRKQGKKADLAGAVLRDANLRDTNLRWANLRGADLRDADLREVGLGDADLRKSNMEGADLSSAFLVDVDLREANLGAVHL
jgi:uncharacterized protein YjbI with pentapeptide repeats